MDYLNHLILADRLSWGIPFQEGILGILSIIFSFFGLAGMVYAVYLGFLLAKAEDENKRKTAKKRIINVISGLLIIILLTGLLASSTLWWEGDDGINPENPIDITSQTGILDMVNAESFNLKQKNSTACKATSIGILLNILYNTNYYSELSSFSFASYAMLANKLNKPAIDGKRYMSDYCTDNGKNLSGKQVTKSELINEINTAVLINRVPIIVETTGKPQHWVVIIGIQGGQYKVLDPASGNTKSWDDGKLGAANPDRYGYVKVYPV